MTACQKSKWQMITLKVELENQLSTLKENYIAAQVELIAFVSKVDGLTENEENILVRRYVFCDEWKAITAGMSFAAGHVFYLHRQALKKIGVKC